MQSLKNLGIVCQKVKRGENGVQPIKKVLIVIVQKDFLKNNIVNMEKLKKKLKRFLINNLGKGARRSETK